MRLGVPGVAGGGTGHFDSPSDVVVAPSGDVFVADGHTENGNNRVVKFSKDGKYIKEWGRTGYGPGEFRTLHAIAMDSRGRVFVADRLNNRIQLFDQEGKFLSQWTQFGRPSGIFFDSRDRIYVADSESDDVQNPAGRWASGSATRGPGGLPNSSSFRGATRARPPGMAPSSSPWTVTATSTAASLVPGNCASTSGLSLENRRSLPVRST